MKVAPAPLPHYCGPMLLVLTKFTEEVSLGRDLAGNMDTAYKAEIHGAQPTIMSDLDSGREPSPITTSNIRAALKKLNQKLRKAPGKDGHEIMVLG